jgi:hypothetical protein
MSNTRAKPIRENNPMHSSQALGFVRHFVFIELFLDASGKTVVGYHDPKE